VNYKKKTRRSDNVETLREGSEKLAQRPGPPLDPRIDLTQNDRKKSQEPGKKFIKVIGALR
jgi:hypothetical protein